MAVKKKKIKVECSHCGETFNSIVFWCSKGEHHLVNLGGNRTDGDCERCVSGRNDRWIKWKKGRESRLSAAAKKIEDPKNWCGCGAVKAYDKWVSSPEYEKRFESPTPVVTDFKEPSDDSIYSDFSEVEF